MYICNVYIVVKAKYVALTPSAVAAAWFTKLKTVPELLTPC